MPAFQEFLVQPPCSLYRGEAEAGVRIAPVGSQPRVEERGSVSGRRRVKEGSIEKGANERGGVLVLFAVMFGALFFTLILLGVNPIVVRSASTGLRTLADQLCQDLTHPSHNTVITRRTAERFSEQLVNQWNAGIVRPRALVSLTEARLIMPTMPNVAFDLFTPSLATLEAGTYLEDPSAVLHPDNSGQGLAFNQLGLPSCLGVGVECRLVTDLDPVSAPDRFPASLWNNVDNAGHTVGCELKARVTRFLAPPVTIVARSAGWKPVRGEYPAYAPYQHLVSGQQAEAPGFTLAIAPHLTTVSTDARFSFPASYGNTFLARNDPLTVLNRNLQGSPLSFVMASPNFAVQPNDHDTKRVANVAGVYVNAPAPIVNPVTNQRLRDFLVHCANPLTLARNLFTGTMLELASRHGQLRGATELLLVGSQSRGVATANDFDDGTGPQGPTIMVPFGADLTQRRYQLPYVTFRTGATSAPPGAFVADDRFGPTPYINPFVNGSDYAGGDLTADLSEFHSLVAGQLRYCYHLYRSTSPVDAEKYIERLIDPVAAKLDNQGFESDTDFSWRNKLSSITGGNQRWDQENPYGDGDLNAAELVSTMGALQRCPYDHPASGGSCLKPNAALPSALIGSQDLRPDVVGLLSYLNSPCSSSSILGLNSPGLFGTGSGEINDASLRSRSVAACGGTQPRNRTPLMLVLHQRLTGVAAGGGGFQGEAAAIRGIVDSIDRPIIVVYFPDNINSASDAALDVLRFAFDISANPTPDDNQLVVFRPESVTAGSEAADFSNYWRHILLDDTPDAVVNRAIDVFNYLLLRPERKF